MSDTAGEDATPRRLSAGDTWDYAREVERLSSLYGTHDTQALHDAIAWAFENAGKEPDRRTVNAYVAVYLSANRPKRT